MPWFVGYYSVHDPIDNKISWAPHRNSKKSSLVELDVPPTKLLKVSKELVGGGSTVSLIELLASYAAGAVAILIWRTQLYDTLKANHTNNEIKAYSGGFFLTYAIVYYTAVVPLFKFLYLEST